MKVCCRCKQELPLEAFGKDKSKQDGLNLKCKQCNRATTNASLKKYPETRKAWRKANPDYQKVWHEAHPGYQKAWHEAHPGYYKNYRKKKLNESIY